ncbi:MAG: type II CAAX endopeptidase family protein [Chloroflexi bacterium]|nr:type II CAAX endopeptidase family protein [Chloroflexota bacterium]
MEDSRSIPTAPSLLKGAPRVWASLALLAIALAMTIPIYGGWWSGSSRAVFRLGMPVLWGVLAIAAASIKRLKPFTSLLLSLFGVSLGFALAYLVGSRPVDALGLSWDTPKGAAAGKVLSEVIPVSAAIFLAAVLSRRSLESLGLRGGRVWLSIALGLLATIPLLALFAFDPSGGRDAVLSTPGAVLRSWLPWIVLFSVANGFMEELWFRGLWLGAFKQALGLPAAMHVTSLAFCIMHVIVYWGDPMAIALLTPAWLFMGYSYALIMRKTGSLWGPVLAHAIADVLFLLIAFSTGKM